MSSTTTDLALQLAPTDELVEELVRRSAGIVLMCAFPVAEKRVVELCRWSRDEYRAAGMAADLQHRILVSLSQNRKEAASLAEAQDRAVQLDEVAPEDDDDGD